MYEYLPWSSQELNKTIEEYKKNKLTILDIELGGTCNFHCIYCDSPDRNKKFRVDMNKINRIIEEKNIRWIYICGLGEPTYGENRDVLMRLLQIADRNHVRCSIFTNLSWVDDTFLEYVRRGVLYLLFKMDSFDVACASKLYGADNSQQKENINKLLKCVRIEQNCTNLAASIVPTKNNLEQIPEIVAWCLKHDIYPLIAELENAGRGGLVYNELSPGKDELAKLKIQLQTENNIRLNVPICPSIIGGLHINSEGMITVDRKTGMSCHWFWLENPSVKSVDSFNEEGELDRYEQEIIQYRKEKTDAILKILDEGIQEHFVFGGCGGSLDEILQYQVGLHS